MAGFFRCFRSSWLLRAADLFDVFCIWLSLRLLIHNVAFLCRRANDWHVMSVFVRHVVPFTFQFVSCALTRSIPCRQLAMCAQVKQQWFRSFDPQERLQQQLNRLTAYPNLAMAAALELRNSEDHPMRELLLLPDDV